MEHRLIQGGEQFLPFARSCVAKLKKLGLPYADQSYEVDGASIKVRVEPGHEYIRIEGTSGVLDMDSGVVDMKAWIGWEMYLPGVFYESSYPLSYNTPFTVTVDTEWRKNPTSAHQISGRITGLPPKGRVRFDGSNSRAFVPGATNTGTEDSPVWVENPADDMLVTKKYMVTTCPASIFTGRCRLYVQAMYGRPEFTDTAYNEDGSIAKPGGRIDGPQLSSANSLVIPSYVPAGDKTSYPGVGINTNSGVFLDRETGNHWLFCVSTANISVFPLISSKYGESLRARLKAGSPIEGTDDQANLEAAILSECRPFVKLVEVLKISLPSLDSMGYGLHWNWTGLVGDIVINNQFPQGNPSGNYFGMESSHYRVDITPLPIPEDQAPSGPSRKFAAATNLLEGPTRWSVWRQVWCIAHTYPGGNTLMKMTPKYSEIFDGDGFFYAFYRGDELIKCRVSVKVIPKETKVSASSGYGGRNVAASIGLSGGYQTDSDTQLHFTAVFSAGPYALPKSRAQRLQTTNESATSPKHILYYEGLGGALIMTSLTLGDGTYFPPKVPGVDQPYKYEIYRIWVGYNYSASTTVTSTSTQVIVAVPKNDSEAIYMGGGEVDNVRDIDRFIYEMTSIRFLSEERVDDVPHTYHQLWGGIGTDNNVITTNNIPDTEANIQVWSEAWMVGKAGQLPATIPGGTYGEFYSPHTDEVNDVFNTRSGTRLVSPIVLTRGKCAPTGAAGHEDINFPALIGYV